MPEGPTLAILRQEASKFEGQKVIAAIGNANLEYDRITGQKLLEICTWGKHLLMRFEGFTIKVHFLLFGSYLIDDTKKAQIRFGLEFQNGNLNFYASQVKMLEQPLSEIYDWSIDIMNSNWDSGKAFKKLKAHHNIMICDNLMNQDIFSGVGNIIKNETLFLTKIHPESITENIPDARLKSLIKLIPEYAADFFRWKKNHEFSDHWQIYHQSICPICKGPVIKKKTGKAGRTSYICKKHQKLY